MSGVYDRWNSGAPLASFTPTERAELRQQLIRHPAYSDAKSPHHATYVADARSLYEADFSTEPEALLVHVNGRAIVAGGRDPQMSRAPVASQEVLTARWNAGARAESFSAPERVQLRRMVVEQPGYRDAKHPDHAKFVQDAAALYALDAPEAST